MSFDQPVPYDRALKEKHKQEEFEQGGSGRGRGKRMSYFITCIYYALFSLSLHISLTSISGAVTDYGSTVVHWLRNRQPRYKGAFQGEQERPSPSYIVDVSLNHTIIAVRI